MLNSEYLAIEEITVILKKYREAIESFKSDKCFISKAVPCLENLRSFCSKKKKKCHPLTCDFIETLLTDYETRFDHIFNVESQKFQICFLLATSIDVEQRKFLNAIGLKPQKEFIVRFLRSTTKKNPILIDDNEKTESSDLELDDDEEGFGNEYDEFTSLATSSSNSQFLAENGKKFPILYVQHQKLNSMSPSSCGIESAFSMAALCEGAKKHRNRLTALNLEKESIIKFNKKLL